MKSKRSIRGSTSGSKIDSLVLRKKLDSLLLLIKVYLQFTLHLLRLGIIR